MILLAVLRVLFLGLFARRDALALINLDLVAAETRESDWQRVVTRRRTTALQDLSLQCSSWRHHACRPTEWNCNCGCHDLVLVAS